MAQQAQLPERPDPSEPLGDLPFPVVAVGASAGGLEAVSHLLERLPADPGLAVIVAMHLAPSVKSELTAILSRVTPMTVREAADGTKVQVNHVYVGPAGSSVVLTDGALGLHTRPPHGVHMPIDHLFRSLARTQG